MLCEDVVDKRATAPTQSGSWALPQRKQRITVPAMMKVENLTSPAIIDRIGDDDPAPIYKDHVVIPGEATGPAHGLIASFVAKPLTSLSLPHSDPNSNPPSIKDRSKFAAASFGAGANQDQHERSVCGAPLFIPQRVCRASVAVPRLPNSEFDAVEHAKQKLLSLAQLRF